VRRDDASGGFKLKVTAASCWSRGLSQIPYNGDDVRSIQGIYPLVVESSGGVKAATKYDINNLRPRVIIGEPLSLVLPFITTCRSASPARRNGKFHVIANLLLLVRLLPIPDPSRQRCGLGNATCSSIEPPPRRLRETSGRPWLREPAAVRGRHGHTV
jgi:hypothetical protein